MRTTLATRLTEVPNDSLNPILSFPLPGGRKYEAKR
jgi:hypothetical protein